MFQTYSGEVKNGHIMLQDGAMMAEGTHVLVTILQPDDMRYWQSASESSLDKIWLNEDDEIYEKIIST
jgi:hypothetical protein